VISTLKNVSSDTFLGFHCLCILSLGGIFIRLGTGGLSQFAVMIGCLGVLSACTAGLDLHGNTVSEKTANVQFSASAQYGQPDLNTNQRHFYSLATPMEPIVVGSKLMVVDSVNRRILIWNTIPSSPTQIPDVVVGQSDLHGFSPNAGVPDSVLVNGSGFPIAASSIGLNNPNGICSDGTKLVVSDTGNHRVLIWNTIPTTSGKSADVVLGQPDFISNAANFDGTITAKSLKSPASASCSSGKLFILDSGNHRALFWNSIPTTSYQAADGVLGQPGFLTGGANQGGRSLSSMSSPRGLLVTSNKLLISDTSNHRVLIWNTKTPSSLQAADYLLGQSSTSTATANSGGLSGHSLSSPMALSLVGTALYVSDYNNHRVLIWDSIPASAAVDANRVLGQPLFTTNTANNGGVSAKSLYNPRGIASNGTKLVIADQNNNRLLIYHLLPTTSFTAANTVWGQIRTDLNSRNGGISPNGSLNLPFYLSDDGTYIWASDSQHNRILRWPANKTPFEGLQPDLVLGQTSMDTTVSTASASQMGGQGNIATDGVKFYFADTSNHRILIWNTYPASSGAAADAVIGQTTMTGSTANSGGVSASTLNSPYYIAVSGGKLIAADSGNHRVLIWNSLPSANGPANVILGQPDDTTVTSGGTLGKMFTPACVHVYDGKLFVCDRSNNRILVWNSVPTSTVPADYVIGQSSDSGVDPNAGLPTVNAIGFNNTLSMTYQGKKLFVSDLNNSRVMIWNKLPTETGVPADAVIGQKDLLTQTSVNYRGTSAQTLWRPIGVMLKGQDLFVVDYYSNRLLKYDGVDR
jgi:hypothetical protein